MTVWISEIAAICEKTQFSINSGWLEITKK